MKKLLKIALGATLALTLAAGPAWAECYPQEEPRTNSCDGDQGWGYHDVTIRRGAHAGTYSVLVVVEGAECEQIQPNKFRRAAVRFIKTGSVAPVADPATWTVTVS